MTQDKKTFGAALLEILMAPWAALPLGFHLGMGRFAGWVAGSVIGYRREEVLINISRSFPEKKYREIKKIYKQFYRHFGEILGEAIWFGGCKGKRGAARLHRQRIVEVLNPEVFNSTLAARDNMLVLSSHAGNWELLGGWFNYNYTDTPFQGDESIIGVVYRQLHSKAWDRFMADNRCAPIKHTAFDGYLEASKVFRFAITHRKEKYIYIFPTDQYPYGIATKHDIGEFMHQHTLAMTGGTALACKFGMSVSYLRWKKQAPGKYTVEFVPICLDPSGETPESLMRKYYDLLEEDLKDQPWNYLWTHRRWK